MENIDIVGTFIKIVFMARVTSQQTKDCTQEVGNLEILMAMDSF
jgi:hypothetical protein